jgi:hypothetical protein
MVMAEERPKVEARDYDDDLVWYTCPICARAGFSTRIFRGRLESGSTIEIVCRRCKGRVVVEE